jgi:membrane protease YdiL (CAAX protease family)
LQRGLGDDIVTPSLVFAGGGVKRLLTFARSVIPADPAQLLFLGGSILLLIDFELRCFPRDAGALGFSSVFGPSSFSFKQPAVWTGVAAMARLPVFFAGAAGLFIGFRPGVRPVRRILALVCLPAVLGLAALFIGFVSMAHLDSNVSVFDPNSIPVASAIRGFLSLGTSVHMWFLGMALVLAFVWRMRPGNASLPLALPDSAARPLDEVWQRIQIFICVSTAGELVISAITGVVLSIFLLQLTPGGGLLRFLYLLRTLLGLSVLIGAAAWACGAVRWKELRQFTRLPETKFGLLGVTIPIAISAVPKLIFYSWDRIHWVAVNFYRYPPPLLAGYFSFPDPVLYWRLPAAAAEEIIWRGYLQPRFIRRFGIVRGIFLLGLVWGAFHFTTDFGNMSRDQDVFVQLASRLANCVSLSYVLGWLTLQSRSVWPAALGHGLYNVWLHSNPQSPPFPMPHWIFWGVLGYLLFRYWPPSSAELAPEPVPENAPEPGDAELGAAGGVV